MKKGKFLMGIVLLAGMYSCLNPSENSTVKETPRQQQTAQRQQTTTKPQTTPTTPPVKPTPTPTPEAPTRGYEEIYEEYSAKLREAGSRYLDEFDQEKIGHESDLDYLANLSTDKVNQLAEIETKGVEEMAEYMYRSLSSYQTYEDWGSKLYAVYEEESMKIMDDYMNSFTIGY